MAQSEQADFHPFDLLDDGLVLAILSCLPDPESLGCAALVNTRLAELCNDPYAWKPLLDSELSEGAGWRERYKQWHALSSLACLHCSLAAGSAQPSARSDHGAAAVSADRAYVFGGNGRQDGLLSDLWMLRCDSVATGTAAWELVAPSLEHTPNARFLATLSPVSLSDSAHPVGLLLFGGHGGESFFNDVWLFDMRTITWMMLLPHTAQAADESVRPDARFGHSAITHNSNSEVVIFGGTGTTGSGFHDVFKDMLSLSVCTREWTRHECVDASPSPRTDHLACRVADSMYIFGGRSAGGSLNDLWEYALGTRAWTQVVSAGGARHLRAMATRSTPARAPAAILCGGGVLVFGGRGSSNECFNGTFLLRLVQPPARPVMGKAAATACNWLQEPCMAIAPSALVAIFISQAAMPAGSAPKHLDIAALKPAA
ncbi:hypothetical protein T492DRAFT_868653 [Pavlovales sp. CCMP2436]|nr:hypothetical protein T492DRAFT_868653 [Pavlovales sp. CCMP2436]